MASRIKNLNVASISPLDPPSEYLAEIPITREVEELVVRSRQEIADIVSGDDDRLLVITGPCSIHDEAAGREYAERLATLSPPKSATTSWSSCASTLRSHGLRSDGKGSSTTPTSMARATWPKDCDELGSSSWAFARSVCHAQPSS